MRWPYLLLLVAGAAAAEPEYHRHFVAPEPGIVKLEPGLPALRYEHAYYLMVIGDDATPSCQAWNVMPDPDGDPQEPTRGVLVRGADTIDYRSRGSELSVCDADATVREDGDDLDVGGARWFHDEASCERAIASHRRVAMDLRACVSTDGGDAMQTRFEDVMEHSGTLFVRGASGCDRIQVLARPDDSLFVRAIDDHTDSYTSYAYGSAHLSLWNEHVIDHRAPDQDAIVVGRISSCGGHPQPNVIFDADAVRTSSATYYLDRKACEASPAREAKRAAWLP